MFFHILLDYKIHEMNILDKYNNRVVKYYVRRLEAALDRRMFTEEPPAKDWNERIQRAINTGQRISDKYEKKLIAIGDKID